VRLSTANRLLIAIGLHQLSFFLVWTAAIAHVEGLGWSLTDVGLFAAVPWLAALAVLPAAPWLIRRAGAKPVALAAVAFVAAGALALLAEAPAALTAGLALIGLGTALRWTAVDSWLVRVTPRRRTGRTLAVAEMVAAAAMIVAPLLASTLAAPTLARVAAAGVACALAGGLACALCRAPGPHPAARAGRRPAEARLVVVVLVAALFGGFFESGFMAAGALVADSAGVAGAAFTVAALVSGGSFAAHYLLGVGSDRWSARAVALVSTAALTVSLVAIALAPGLAVPASLAVGAFGGGLYTLAVIIGVQGGAADPARIVALAAIAYTGGTMLSPPTTGMALDAIGAAPTLAALAAATLVLLAVVAATGGSGARSTRDAPAAG
jgi:predicted MFS family arabinose efflux permease